MIIGGLAGPGGALIGASIGSSIFGFLGEAGGKLLGKWRAENEEKQKNDTRGHYEYTGVNGIPVWVEPQVPAQITQPKAALPAPTVELGGQADLNVHVDISGERPTAQVTVKHNSIRSMRFNTGDTADVWMIP
jgi:hypothetical protein